MDSYTASVEFQNDDMENLFLFKLFINEFPFVEFEFENIVSVSELNDFINYYYEIDSEYDYELNFGKDYNLVYMISRGENIVFQLSTHGCINGNLVVTVKKNKSLFDCLTKILSFAEEKYNY